MHVAYTRCQPENPMNIADILEPRQNTDVLFRSSVTSSIGKLPGTSLL